ncbi:MAG: carbohydrate-binding protein [Chitinivibrionales bacterium]|nr:carbohydrate-binding protein [Chitinivibrionales bacterium]
MKQLPHHHLQGALMHRKYARFKAQSALICAMLLPQILWAATPASDTLFACDTSMTELSGQQLRYKCANQGILVQNPSGSWVKFKDIDFGSGYKYMYALYNLGGAGRIDLVLDSIVQDSAATDGAYILNTGCQCMSLFSTLGWEHGMVTKYPVHSKAPIPATTDATDSALVQGVHDVYLRTSEDVSSSGGVIAYHWVVFSNDPDALHYYDASLNPEDHLSQNPKLTDVHRNLYNASGGRSLLINADKTGLIVNKAGMHTLSLHAINGQHIYTKSISGPTTMTLDSNKLAKGMYLATISFADGNKNLYRFMIR